MKFRKFTDNFLKDCKAKQSSKYVSGPPAWSFFSEPLFYFKMNFLFIFKFAVFLSIKLLNLSLRTV